MEEKERFTFDTSSMCFYDKRTNISINYNNYELLCNILNQQDKEIKKLEEYNNKYPYHYSEKYMKNNRKLETENQQLKQQLHDLPKKIVEDIEKNFTEYLPLKDKTGAGFYCRLNAILKKYGGEDE